MFWCSLLLSLPWPLSIRNKVLPQPLLLCPGGCVLMKWGKNMSPGILKSWFTSTWWPLLWAHYWYQPFSPHGKGIIRHYTISEMRRMRPNVSQLGHGQAGFKPGSLTPQSPPHSNSKLPLSGKARWPLCLHPTPHSQSSLRHVLGTLDRVTIIPPVSVGKSLFPFKQKLDTAIR